MPIVQQGQLNTTALVVPDLYVQIVPPQNLVVNGVPTNVLGVVGTSSWGPVNTPRIVSTMADYAAAFGPVMARKYDMGTQVATAVQQGASNFRCVRVTDGTDTAASVTVQTNCITLTALYTGSLGASITVQIAVGSKTGTWKAIVGLAGLQPEVFDNISGSGNAFWVALASALNNGQSTVRGPSQLVIGSAGAGSTTPTAATYSLSGGNDGVSSITGNTLIGADATPRSGMYVLRGQGCSVGVLADCDTSTTWTAQAAFGLSEGIYLIVCGPAGDSITNAVTVKSGAGLDSYAIKYMHGDWVYWSDTTNSLPARLVSPQGFVAGRLANMSPEQSSLNKTLYSVIGTQKVGYVGTGVFGSYSSAELQTLFQAGIDVITNPGAGSLPIWTVRCGHNSSSNAATNGDNYTRMTNYIASTLAAGMGLYVGQVINSTLFLRIKATLLSYLQNMLGQGLLGTTDGSLPFSVVCDLTNNPVSRTSLGYVQADAQIQYQAINEKFIVNIEGGQTVQVRRQTLPTGQINS